MATKLHAVMAMVTAAFCLSLAVPVYAGNMTLLGGSSNTAYSWQNVTIGGGGFVSSIIAAPNDPNVFYARTDVGGAYRWEEESQSWIPILDWVSSEETGYLGVDGIAVDPSVSGRVYVLLGIDYLNDGKSAFARSEDYGATWEVFDVTDTFRAHGNGMGRGNGERIVVDPNNSNIIFLGTRKNGLWKSTNRGSTWTQLSLDYTPNIERDMHESGVCTLQIDKTSGANGASSTIYAGISRETDNVYVSHDGGDSWSLISGQPTEGSIRPQRLALTSDGRYLYITYGNGAGPHAMLWSGVTDYFNRGAIYKYDTQESSWTDISPENFMLNLDQVSDDDTHLGAYSGISIDPNDENVILATSINSWRAPQFWYMDGTWVDSWGDNIYLSEDGGETWREMFRYYWVDGGIEPDYTMIDENGYPWIVGEKIHWNGAIVIDPNNSDRAFVVSGNGIFSTDNLHDSYTSTDWEDNVEVTSTHGKATWKFTSKGLEETVPLDMVSLPDGPLVSVIGDYDGFVHENLNEPSEYGRLSTMVNGSATHIGTTTGLDYAALSPTMLAKAGGNDVSANGQDVTICGVSLSDDGGLTWNQIYSNPTGVSLQPVSGTFYKGEVAMSADGAVVLWSPMSTQSSGEANHPELFRYLNSGWTKAEGVEFSCDPEADRVNANIMYAYDMDSGYMYVSEDKGENFEQAGYAGTSDYWTARAVPGVEGDIWVPLADGGLTRSTDTGQTFTTVSGITWCEAVGFGKAASGASFPTVFIFGTLDGVTGVFRSTDQGASWVRVNDDDHEYGGPGNACMVIGDMNVFGRVYMSTAGRGIVYGEPTGDTVSVTGVSVTPSTASVDVGNTVRLTATVSPSGATNKAVSWETSNDSVATVNISGLVTGLASGQATITATTADGGFTATATVTVQATDDNSDPTAAVSASPLSGEAPLTVSFSAASSSDPDGDTLSYAWDFGDGTTGSGVTVSHTYSAEGDYLAQVTVTDGNGGEDIASVDITVTGSQQETRYTLTLQSGEGGTIDASPAAEDGTYADGDEVTLIANADDGYDFAGWSGDASGTNTIVTVVMDANKTVTASFEPDDDNNGTDTCEDPTSITLPFEKNGTGEYCWVTTQKMEYINSWALDKLTINGVDYANTWASDFPQAVDGKWVIHYEGSYLWSHFDANPAEGTDSTDDGGNDSSDVSDDDDTVTEQYSLVSQTTGSGTVTMTPSGGTYDEGTSVSLTATPADGYEFSGWSGDAQGTETTISITMDGDKSVTASFSVQSSSQCDDDEIQVVSLPTTVKGPGSFCLFTTDDIGHVNSWLTDSVTINGADYTNKWSASMPAKKDGGYYIRVEAPYKWSRFKAKS